MIPVSFMNQCCFWTAPINVLVEVLSKAFCLSSDDSTKEEKKLLLASVLEKEENERSEG